MGTSPASSEMQKRIREIIKGCSNPLNIKDDVLIYGKGREHDKHLHSVLKVLSEEGITLQSEKCSFWKPYVKWFGNIYSEDGMSLDPDKCKINKQFSQTKSTTEVKSFLRTAQLMQSFLPAKMVMTSPTRS